MAVSIAQMRAALTTLVTRASHKPLGLRLSEFELLKEYVGAVDAVLGELDADPHLIEVVREAARARRAGR